MFAAFTPSASGTASPCAFLQQSLVLLCLRPHSPQIFPKARLMIARCVVHGDSANACLGASLLERGRDGLSKAGVPRLSDLLLDQHVN
jgi:hypothetical protein